MAKGQGTPDGGAATATGTGQEKVQDKASGGKGAGDVPAAAAGEEQLVIRASVHCDGCGRKLRRSLQRLQGVGEVRVDSRTNTVVVRGRAAVENATEVVQVVERKTREKAVLVSPSPEKLPPNKGGGETNKKSESDGANTKDDVANDELPEVDMEMATVLKMNLHCDACSEEIKRRVLKITGVEEAVPHLKSSQMMVKGKVEPATLVGFIHKCTGRKAAIIRAEPLDEAPETESKKDENPSGEEKKKNNGGQQNGNKKEEPNEENKGGGGGGEEEDKNVDEKPSGGSHAGAGDAPNNDGVVLENHSKNDRLFTVPMPAEVVTAAVAPEMALINNRSYCYPSYPSYGQYYYPYQQYQYPQPAYPAYACSPAAAAAMYGYGYGYGYPANYPPEAFCEENPNACTIV